MKSLGFGLLVAALSTTAGLVNAATLSLAGTGYASYTLDGTYEAGGNDTYNSFDPSSVARAGSKLSVLTEDTKNASNGLSVSGPAKVTYTYLGFEALLTNIALLASGTEFFRNLGATASSTGDSFTTTVASGGLLDFMFKTAAGNFTGMILNSGGAEAASDNIGIGYSQFFNGGSSVIVMFDDAGNGPDRDYDDLVMRIDVESIDDPVPVPVPAAGLMLLGALGSLAMARRCQRAV